MEDEIGGAFGMPGSKKTCTQSFDCETWRK